VQTAIAPIVERVVQNLKSDRSAQMAWDSIPLATFGDRLPSGIQSSWIFVLRAGAVTGAERHPNSRQRMMSWRGGGDLQTGGAGSWRSHRLVSEAGANLEQRWISVPPNVWHQAVVADQNWVVVSFHTVPARELIEERPDASNDGPMQQRRYV
jgi:hypothetical protein